MADCDEVIYARLEGIADMHHRSWSTEASQALAAARTLKSYERSDPEGARVVREVAAGQRPDDRIEAHLDNRRREFLAYMVRLEEEAARREGKR